MGRAASPGCPGGVQDLVPGLGQHSDFSRSRCYRWGAAWGQMCAFGTRLDVHSFGRNCLTRCLHSSWGCSSGPLSLAPGGTTGSVPHPYPALPAALGMLGEDLLERPGPGLGGPEGPAGVGGLPWEAQGVTHSRRLVNLCGWRLEQAGGYPGKAECLHGSPGRNKGTSRVLLGSWAPWAGWYFPELNTLSPHTSWAVHQAPQCQGPCGHWRVHGGSQEGRSCQP